MTHDIKILQPIRHLHYPFSEARQHSTTTMYLTYVEVLNYHQPICILFNLPEPQAPDNTSLNTPVPPNKKQRMQETAPPLILRTNTSPVNVLSAPGTLSTLSLPTF